MSRLGDARRLNEAIVLHQLNIQGQDPVNSALEARMTKLNLMHAERERERESQCSCSNMKAKYESSMIRVPLGGLQRWNTKKNKSWKDKWEGNNRCGIREQLEPAWWQKKTRQNVEQLSDFKRKYHTCIHTYMCTLHRSMLSYFGKLMCPSQILIRFIRCFPWPSQILIWFIGCFRGP